jgi:hypothetical protein
MYSVIDEDIRDLDDELGGIAMEVKIALPMSHNTLTSVGEYVI